MSTYLHPEPRWIEMKTKLYFFIFMVTLHLIFAFNDLTPSLTRLSPEGKRHRRGRPRCRWCDNLIMFVGQISPEHAQNREVLLPSNGTPYRLFKINSCNLKYL